MRQDCRSSSGSGMSSTCDPYILLQQKLMQIQEEKNALSERLFEMLSDSISTRGNADNIINNIVEDRFCETADLSRSRCYEWLAENEMFFESNINVENLVGYRDAILFSRELPILKEDCDMICSHINLAEFCGGLL